MSYNQNWTPESLYSYFRRAVDRRQLHKEFRDKPIHGPSMIVDAYRDETMEDCRNCKSNKNVVAFKPGRAGYKAAVYRFTCKNCGAKF